MPSRKINTRGKKLSLNLDKSPADTAPASEPTDTAPAIDTAPAVSEPAPAIDVSEPAPADTAPANEPAPAIDPALANDTDLTDSERTYLASLPDPDSERPTTAPANEPAPTAPAANEPAAPSEPAPASEPSNRSKLQAEFDERRVAAISSSLPLYDGPSLAVHRSDKQPADAAYLSRVAKPVQIAKTIKPRDDASLLACYDHLTTYYAGDYSAGFNPARFGADLGAISRNASLNRLGLTPDGQHVVLTPLGLANARNLAASRAKLAK
jgi:hypothetical protein